MEILTSKTSMIKSLLLCAWRERWDEVIWGINIKKILPRGVSGDVYDLSDAILQQAMVAPNPNQLFIKYLNHCISSQMVSYGAVMSAVAKFHDWNKPHCVLCLLDFLAKYKDRIMCNGNEEECIALCKSIGSTVNWLYTAVHQSMVKLAELKHQLNQSSALQMSDSIHYQTIFEKSCELLSFIGSSPFLKAALYVGKIEDPQTFNQFMQKHTELESKLQSANNLMINKEAIDTIMSFLQRIEWIDSHPAIIAAQQLTASNNYKSSSPTTFASLNAIIAFDAVLNPASDIEVCVNQILMIAKFNDLPMADLYCEIIRACLVGLVDAGGSPEDPKHSSFLNSWAAFTFLKVPQLLSKLHALNTSSSTFKSGDTNDVDVGLDKLLSYSPLLDLTDSKSNCDCLQCLLNELCKTELMTNARAEKIIAKRKSDTQSHRNLPRTDQQQSAQTGPVLILRAEPTVTSILKTLDSDYSKNQEALLGVLCHMNGKSFELILCAAAATGKLLSFTTKLIKFNEFNKQAIGEGGKASQTRALLFDITFLMLCYIAQHYGTDIITLNNDTKDSFFAKWCAQNLTEGGRYKCPDLLLANCDSNKVDLLLNQFTSTDGDFKTSLVKWHEVCINAPMAIKEVLLAWEHGAISTDNVKLILDNVKSKMCSLPVVISAWLCSYINILHHEERLKPMNMLQQFMTPLPLESSNPVPSTGESSHDAKPQSNDQIYYKERSTLMANIIKKMLYDLHPPTQSKSKGIISAISHGLTVKTPLWDIMEANFCSAHERSWLDLKTVYNMDTLLCVGGPQWFTDTLVRQVLKFEHSSDLNRAIDLVFGLFHMDIEQCALALLVNILPSYLLNESKQEFLCEPKATALVRLTVMTIYDALCDVENERKKNVPKRLGRKRHYHQDLANDSELMDTDEKMGSGLMRPTKLLRQSDAQSDLLDNTPFAFEKQSVTDESAKPKSDLLNEPIYKSIASFMRLLASIASDSNISHRTIIPILFLEQLILCVKSESHKILQFMPMNLIQCLIRTMPESITFEFLLAISNVSTVRSRKITARALCQLSKAKQMR